MPKAGSQRSAVADLARAAKRMTNPITPTIPPPNMIPLVVPSTYLFDAPRTALAIAPAPSRTLPANTTIAPATSRIADSQ